MATIRQEFNKAFGEARSRGSKTFEFRGKTYGTELAKPKPKVEVGPHGPGSEEFLADGPKMRSEEKDTSPRDKYPMRSEEKDRSLKDNYPMRSEEKDTLPVDAAPMRSEEKDRSLKDNYPMRSEEKDTSPARFKVPPNKSLAQDFQDLKDLPSRAMNLIRGKTEEVEKRKGGMVNKKMSGGGSVRGAGCATKGKGKLRMY
jgi:hypothetical protein